MMNDVMMVTVLVCGLMLRLVLRKIFPADVFLQLRNWRRWNVHLRR